MGFYGSILSFLGQDRGVKVVNQCQTLLMKLTIKPRLQIRRLFSDVTNQNPPYGFGRHYNPIISSSVITLQSHSCLGKMATDDKISRLGTFSILFNKNVPHVQEKIFFSLDYDSLKACGEVCKTWHE